MVQNKNIKMEIILTIVTCGIYGILWFIRLTDDINYVSGNTQDTSGVMAFVFNLLTCGLYGIYWYCKMGEKLDQAEMSKGSLPMARGVLYLVLGVFGFGIIAYALMQDTLNKMA